MLAGRPLLTTLWLLTIAAAPLRSEVPEPIAGRVLDPAGSPLAGAEVWLITDGIPDEEWDRQLAAGPTAVTGGDGRFRLPRPDRIPDGTALYVCHSGRRTGFERVLPPASGPFTFRLEPAGVLAGRVLDPHSRPVPEARVLLSLPGGHPGCYRQRPYPCTVEDSVATDPEGRFAFDFLPPGWYELTVRADGYLGAAGHVTRVEAGDPTLVQLRVDAGVTVLGRLRSATGEPAADVEVCAGPRQSCDVTAKDGSFRLAALPARSMWKVWAVDLDLGEAEQEVEIRGPENRVDLVLDGRSGRHLVRGRLLSPDGTPLAGRELAVGESFVTASTITGADGSYELRLEPGPYAAAVRQDGVWMAVTPALEIGDRPRDLDLRLETGTIEGRVLGLAAGTLAEVYMPRGLTETNTAPVGPGGHYRFSGVPAGSWTLKAIAGDRETEGHVALSRDGAARLDLTFRPEWVVSGRILEAAGKPAAGAEIRFRGSSPWRAVRSGTDGSFSLTMEAGVYRIEGRWQGPFQTLSEISISAGGAAGLELRLPPPVVLAGRVLGLAPGEQAALSASASTWTSRSRESGGLYRFPDLAPGDWSVGVEVRDPRLSYPAAKSFSLPLEIPAGHHEVDFDIPVPQGPCSVTVAAPGARVLWLRSPEPSGIRAWTSADETGLFRFGALPAGRYSIGASYYQGEDDLEIELGESTGREIRIELPPVL